MTPEQLAEVAAFWVDGNYTDEPLRAVTVDDAVALVRNERERCARIAEEQAAKSKRDADAGFPDESHLAAESIAERIRDGSPPDHT